MPVVTDMQIIDTEGFHFGNPRRSSYWTDENDTTWHILQAWQFRTGGVHGTTGLLEVPAVSLATRAGRHDGYPDFMQVQWTLRRWPQWREVVQRVRMPTFDFAQRDLTDAEREEIKIRGWANGQIRKKVDLLTTGGSQKEFDLAIEIEVIDGTRSGFVHVPGPCTLTFYQDA